MGDWRLAVDIGGTFTDAVLLDGDTGRLVVDKTLSTPAHPLDGVRQGVTGALARAGIAPQDVRAPVVHATTLVTNALIEGKTARAALVTNRGFADTLLIRNEHRYDMYDLQIEFPPPPIPRSLTFEVDERTTAEGTVLRAPDPAEAASGGGGDATRRCRGSGRQLPARLCQSGQRTGGRRGARRRARCAGLHVERGCPADP